MYTLTAVTDNQSQKTYPSFDNAMAVAERLISIIRAKQKRFGRHLQFLDYVSIDSETEYDLFYFDGSKLK